MSLLFVALSARAELVTTERPSLETTLVHGHTGLVRRDSPGVFGWFAGAGGGPRYSVRATMTSILEMHLEAGWDAVAAENPMYWRRDAEDAVRIPIIARHATLDAQLAWMYGVIAEIVEGCRAVGDPNKRLFLGGRSNGASLLMEGLYRYIRGDARAAVFARVEGILVYGLHGHTAEDVDMFQRLEYVAHVGNRGLLDPLVLPRSGIYFRDMGYAPENPTPVRRAGVFHVPHVIGVQGQRDPYIYPWEARRTFRALMERLPQVPGRYVISDTAHDLAEGENGYLDNYEYTFPVPNDRYYVRYRPLERLRPVVDLLIHNHHGRPARAGVWSEMSLPSPERVQLAPSCASSTARGKNIDEAAYREFFRDYFTRYP